MESTIDTLKKRLAQHKGRWPRLARHAGVPVSTLRKIVYGEIESPGVLTVDKLNRGLDTFSSDTRQQ